MITVEAQEMGTRLEGLLTAVEEQGEIVLIQRDGKPVAELRAHATVPPPRANKPIDRLRTYPELQGKILYDPTEPATEDEWPSEFR